MPYSATTFILRYYTAQRKGAAHRLRCCPLMCSPLLDFTLMCTVLLNCNLPTFTPPYCTVHDKVSVYMYTPCALPRAWSSPQPAALSITPPPPKQTRTQNTTTSTPTSTVTKRTETVQHYQHLAFRAFGLIRHLQEHNSSMLYLGLF